MDMFIPLLLTVGGFIILIKSADWLVEGASSLARHLGVSDLVIGLTIVSFGTSAPELLVNIVASFKGSADIAIGNIIGSNISNTLMILGATAMIAPLAVQKSTVFKEVPFSLLATLAVLIMVNDFNVDGYTNGPGVPLAELGRGDGIVLIGFFIIFMYYTFGMSSKSDAHEEHTTDKTPGWISAAMIGGGLIGLGIGGELTVRGAIEIASLFGLSEALIGLTIVAIGTSLPELVTSVVAALKNKADISVGNIVGSNIFNLLWILGISSIIHPLPFKPEMNTDIVVTVFATVMLFVFIHTGHIHRRIFWWRQKDGHMLSRLEGSLMLMSYLIYIAFLIVREMKLVA